MERIRNVVGLKIRQLRDSKEMSQQRLSVLCSVAGYEINRSTLAKIESQIRAISDVELFVIAKAIGVRIEILDPENFTETVKKGKVLPFHIRRETKRKRS